MGLTSTDLPASAAGAAKLKGSKPPLRAKNGVPANPSKGATPAAKAGRGGRSPLKRAGSSPSGGSASHQENMRLPAASDARAPGRAASGARPGSARLADAQPRGALGSRPTSAGGRLLPAGKREAKFATPEALASAAAAAAARRSGTGSPARPPLAVVPIQRAAPKTAAAAAWEPEPIPEEESSEGCGEEGDLRRSAAGTIQRWYRRLVQEKEEAREEVRRMLAERRRIFLEAEEHARGVRDPAPRLGADPAAAERAAREDEAAAAAAEEYYRAIRASSASSTPIKSRRCSGESPAASPSPYRRPYPASDDDFSLSDASSPLKDLPHHYSTPGKGAAPASPPELAPRPRSPGGALWESCSSAASLARASVAGPLAARAAPAAEVAASLALDAGEFLEFTREVAARVIQHYAREWLAVLHARRASRVRRADAMLAAFEQPEEAEGEEDGFDDDEASELAAALNTGGAQPASAATPPPQAAASPSPAKGMRARSPSPSPAPSSGRTDDSAYGGRRGRAPAGPLRKSAAGKLSGRPGWAAAEEENSAKAPAAAAPAPSPPRGLYPADEELEVGDDDDILARAEAALAAPDHDAALAFRAEVLPSPAAAARRSEGAGGETREDPHAVVLAPASPVPPSPAPTVAASEASSARTLPIGPSLAASLELVPRDVAATAGRAGPTRGELLHRTSRDPTAPPAVSSEFVRTSMRLSAEKLSSILQYLDEVEDSVLPTPRLGSPHAAAAAAVRGGAAGGAARVEGSEVGSDATSAEDGAPRRDAPLAATVYEGVRNKMKEMRDAMAAQDDHVARLQAALADARAREAEARALHAAELEVAVEAQKSASDASLARHLELIDRLLADKDGLAQKCAELTHMLAQAERAAEEGRAAMRAQFGEELKKHKEAWAASEKIRRETWVAEKTRDIKEMTIKGLEPEIQRLMQKHKADLRRAEQRGQEEARRAREALGAQHEQYASQLRDRLMKEREDALEKERIAASARLREQAERYEGQASQQRARMAGDLEMQIERLEAARREDKQRHEDALERRRREEGEREEVWRAEATRDAEEARRRHQLEVKELRGKLAAENEGWREALAEKAARELEEKERELRAALARERDEEINLVLRRFEEEASRARAAAEEERGEREEALVARHSRHVKELQDSERMYADKYRAAASSLDAALERLRSNEAYAESLGKELASKSETVSWLEGQVSGAKGDQASRERDLRDTFAKREEVLAAQAEAAEARARDAAKRADMASGECDALRVRKAEEMEALECRVRATISRKDEAITQLRAQLHDMQGRLTQTEAVLERQRAELLS